MSRRPRDRDAADARAGGAGETDPDAGVWRGQKVARRFVSPDGMVVLVGRSATDNDILSIKLGSPRDFWMHVAAESGSHVIVRNPENLARLPRETLRFAAGLAAAHSRARHGGRVAVHVARCSDVSKPRGFAPGKVLLDRYETVQAAPARDVPDPAGEEQTSGVRR
ncbi:MAG TPA: NFACT RNA binding domain-containing protein [Candidatus Binatia bacterium]|nr:NFACT RNA binding domain-containing protein [Candidatus Binatia bacterium]